MANSGNLCLVVWHLKHEKVPATQDCFGFAKMGKRNHYNPNPGALMLRSIEAKDHMTVSPVTVKKETPIFAAIQALLDRKISGATVVDDNNEVVGVISEMDCLKAILNGIYHGEAGGTVGEIMTTTVESGDPAASVLQIAQQLISGNRRRLPVVRHGKFYGQYSCRSILRAVIEFAGDPQEPQNG